MTRTAARVDTVHAEIRDGLRKLGCSVYDTARMGRDFPDLVVGCRGTTFLLEVKWNRPTREGGRHRESEGQGIARAAWAGGPWRIVTGLLDAVRALGLERELAAELEHRS